jgi:glutaredoxin
MDPLTRTGIARIIVYSKLGRCVQCDATKRRLNELGARYDDGEPLDAPEHAELLTAFKTRGFVGAPVVVLLNADGSERDAWSGFRPDLVDEHLKAVE